LTIGRILLDEVHEILVYSPHVGKPFKATAHRQETSLPWRDCAASGLELSSD